jgi:hypothetical protein
VNVLAPLLKKKKLLNVLFKEDLLVIFALIILASFILTPFTLTPLILLLLKGHLLLLLLNLILS